MGHGKTVGKCGHVIAQCRCMEGHRNVTQVDALCLDCGRLSHGSYLAVANVRATKADEDFLKAGRARRTSP